MFRPVEDEYDEEPGFWRVSRITSSILSFGLYGALVAAAVLIFLNLRTADTRPAAAKIEAAPSGGGLYPSTYSGVSRWNFRWIKVHRYWFGWSMARGFPVVTNVFYETSAMWKSGRIKADAGDLELF